jgi:NAD+ diphosphatase
MYKPADSNFIPSHAALARATTLTFVFRGDELLLREDAPALPEAQAYAALNIGDAGLHPVGVWEERYCQAAWVERHTEAPAGTQWAKLRSLFGVLEGGLPAVAGRAYQIAEWVRTHQFCGVCATPMRRVATERSFKCPGCGMVAYPRISPAMMVLIKKGDHILLARNSGNPSGRFSALAGFLEAGESIEEAVHREVFEEVGLQVKDLKYFGSQAWPFPHSLMIAFTAEYAGGEVTPDKIEIAEAGWFGPGDALPPIPALHSVAGWLIRANLPEAVAATASSWPPTPRS